MPIKWPDLPPTVAKAISLGFFIGCAVIEITNFVTLYGKRESHCIKGFELAEPLGFHILLVSGVVATDVIYIIVIVAAMPFKTCNFGADLSTIAYNIIAGALCQVSMAKVAPLIFCGNEAFPIIKNSVLGCMSTAAILHWANAGISLVFISKSERHLSILRSGDY